LVNVISEIITTQDLGFGLCFIMSSVIMKWMIMS